MDFECPCKKCLNYDPPDAHEVCPCEYCHEVGAHEFAVDWAEVCDLCDKALDESNEED